MASKLSAEQLQLVKWRLEHGETVSGQGRVETFEAANFTHRAQQVVLSTTIQSLQSGNLKSPQNCVIKMIVTSMKCKEVGKQIQFPL